MSIQDEADAILARALTVVCDGWYEPRHARIVIKVGDPERVSHGMCSSCKAWADRELDKSDGDTK